MSHGNVSGDSEAAAGASVPPPSLGAVPVPIPGNPDPLRDISDELPFSRMPALENVVPSIVTSASSHSLARLSA